MSLPLNEVVQATCPGCKNTLRIPGNWIGQSMKCKHCGMVFQAKAPEKPVAATPVVAALAGDKPKKKKRKKRNILANAARMTKLVLDKAIPRRRKKKRKHGDVPSAKPHMPPPAIPLGTAPAAGLPAAVPITAGAAALPAAIPISAAPAAGPAFNLPPVRRRSRGRIQKFVFIGLFFLVLGVLGSIIQLVMSNPEKFQASNVPLGGALDPMTGKSETKPVETQLRPPIPTQSATRPPIQQPSPTSLTGPNPSGPNGPKTNPPIGNPTGMNPPNGTNPPNGMNPPIGPRPTGITGLIPPVAVNGNFPRRLLAVIPANYAFATPISYGGTGPRNLTTVVQQFGELLRVSPDQTVLLSDRAPLAKPPIKDVIVSNVENFLKSSRPDDRIILMFIGHGVEVGGKPYLMPLEGEKDNAENLIPLEWVMGQLEKCPARQKIFVVDVCRSDPIRGEERGKVDPMGEKFDALLKTPPPGVQVLTACVAGQNSFEVPPTGTLDGQLEGGIMLSQVPDVKLKGGLKGVIQRPEDSIPIAALANSLAARTGAMARVFLKSEQTVRVTGTEAESKLVYDPKLAAPAKFELKLTGIFEKGVAAKADIEGLFRDINGIPPVKRSDGANTVNFDSLPPFPLDKVAVFKDDGGTSPLREKVKEAVALLKENNQQFQEVFLRNFSPDNQQQSGNFKNQIAAIQMNAGLVQFKLDTVLEELDGMQDARAKEPRRWQANYDYVRARLAAKIAYVYEYNAKLGDMRKEYPAMDPMIHKGWQLASKEKISDRDADKYAKRAKQYLEQLGKENAGTPWELFAKRDKITALGLDWQPSPK